MRERLIELLNEAREKCANTPSKNCKECSAYGKGYGCISALIADYLLANGVIIPPCKVGDTVYFVARNSGEPIGTIDEIEIVQIARRKEEFHAKGRFKGSLNEFEIRAFKIDNYSFFLTREEAEAALRKEDEGK